ncbi:MAG: hypothetical protein WCA31_01025 [Acidimicrobiales bacterium]
MGNEVGLWGTTLSPAFGTVSWTSWWADLGTLDTSTTRLATDKAYMDLAAEGLKFVDGVDDHLYQALYLTEGDFTSMKVVSTVRAVSAVGQAEAAVTHGISIAQKFEAMTGSPVAFFINLTGNYGGVNWLSAFEDLASFEVANNKAASDEGWIKYLDSLRCYAQDSGASQATLFAKIP